ncbi:MAG: diguanylate cyclase [Sphaerochaetaceae bacterium]|nr:diguanylate cyclase [Sphaerochaetaceae bacterium]
MKLISWTTTDLAIIKVLTLLLLLICPVTAGSTEMEQTIRFIGNEDLAPIIYLDNGEAEGVVADIARELGSVIGQKVIIETAQWEEGQKMVIEGSADALLQMNPSPLRAQFFDFSVPLLESEFSIFRKIGNRESVDMESLKGKTIGVENGGFPHTFLQQLENFNLYTFSDWDDGFKRLQSGEIDMIIADRWIGEYHLAENRINDIQIIDSPIESQHSAIAVKKGNIELLSRIDDALIELEQNGMLDTILRKWKGQRVIYLTERKYKTIMLYFVFAALSMVLILSLISMKRYRRLSHDLEIEVKKRTEQLSKSNEMLRNANVELEKLAVVDELTSLTNRRGFESEIGRLWYLSRLKGVPLAIIMLDIDLFKQFNDTYGHLEGDRCLISISSQIRKNVQGEQNLCARYGGEEFIAALFDTDEQAASLIAERIRSDVEDLALRNETTGSPVTVSCGVAAAISQNYLTIDGLIDNADQALYKAKQSGRNKTVRFSTVI